MPSFYSLKRGLTVAPARASFEDVPLSVEEILERNRIDKPSNDGYAGCEFKHEEDKGALDLMPQKTVMGRSSPQEFGRPSGCFHSLFRLRNPSGIES